MTRDEAITKLRAVILAHDGYISERSVEMSLDGYVALGMIKLDDDEKIPISQQLRRERQ